MKIYLVGGAVRDKLLGREIKERDYVVVGATPKEMESLGYKAVGKEFPVFLHPDTQEEYALARTERKVGKGYKGFEFYADPSVTLEEDLQRRDLTINAIAEDNAGHIIDPFNGKKDLEAKIFKHVSPAFSEDPVRILRVARFAARFPDFNVHPDTNKLMKDMVKNGEVNALVPERVWKEFSRALAEPSPERFFTILKDSDALPILFNELTEHYLENLNNLMSCTKRSQDPVIRFAALLIDIPESSIKSLCKRLRAPRNYTDLAIITAKYQNAIKNLSNENPEEVINFLEKIDAFRRPERLKPLLIACDSDKFEFLNKALETAKSVSTQALIDQGLKDKEFGDELHALRVKTLFKNRDNLS